MYQISRDRFKETNDRIFLQIRTPDEGIELALKRLKNHEFPSLARFRLGPVKNGVTLHNSNMVPCLLGSAGKIIKSFYTCRCSFEIHGLAL